MSLLSLFDQFNTPMLNKGIFKYYFLKKKFFGAFYNLSKLWYFLHTDTHTHF